MEEALYTLLTGLGYTAAWGGLGQGTTLPRLAIYQVGGTDDLTLEGRAGFVTGLVQIDVYGATYLQARDVSIAITEALSGYSGDVIWSAQMVNKRGRPDEAGGDVIQRISLDFALIWCE